LLKLYFAYVEVGKSGDLKVILVNKTKSCVLVNGVLSCVM